MGAQMTSKERLLTAIRHEQPDRVPVAPKACNFFKEYYGCACWMHELKAAEEFDFDPIIHLLPTIVRDIIPLWMRDIPLKNFIHSWAECYNELEDVTVDLHIERYPDHTMISRKIKTPAGILTDKLKQAKPDMGFGTWPYPEHIEPILKGKEDLEKVRYLLPNPKKESLHDIKAISDVVGERGLVAVNINSALDFKLLDGFGHVQLMTLLHDDRPLFLEFLRLFHEHAMAETKACLEAGAEAILGTWFNSSMSMGWGPNHFRELFVPLVREHVELVHSYKALYLYYDDGKMMDILQMIADCGIDVVFTLCPPPVGDVELAKAKEMIGDRVCLNGNIDLIYTIKMGTPEKIHAVVKKAVSDAAKGGGFILGTSDSIREAPIENVRAYFEAGRKYGKYS